MLHSVFADLLYELEDLIAEDDKVAARMRAHGIHQGEYFGAPRDRKAVTYSEVLIFRIADHQIAEWWLEVNRLEILQQMGVTITPAQATAPKHTS
jgi:predicted ester cyclase